MIELCCSVNPKETCRACNGHLCAEHVKKGRVAHNYLWCRSCADINEDYITIIEELSDKLSEAIDEFDVVAGLVDDIHGHTSRCRNCRNDASCPDIFGIIENAGTHTTSVHRRVMRLNR